MTRTRRPCPCEASPALDGEAARIGRTVAYLTRRTQALLDLPALPTPPERRRVTDLLPRREPRRGEATG